MTSEAQRIALAKWMGWTCTNTKYLTGLCPTDNVAKYTAIQIINGEVPLELIPNYPSDLNACHEVEVKLTNEQHKVFSDWLPILRKASATAAQRCEALCRALGLWEEESK